MPTQEMIATRLDVRGRVNPALIAAIDAACARGCTSCADACLAEESVTHLRQCHRDNLDCADVGLATATLGNPAHGLLRDRVAGRAPQPVVGIHH